MPTAVAEQVSAVADDCRFTPQAAAARAERLLPYDWQRSMMDLPLANRESCEPGKVS